MKTFEMDCFEITESDGCGVRSNHLAFVSTEAVAKTITDRSKGWRSYAKYKKLIVVFDSADEFDDNTKNALRKSAMAKLTSAEKEALGLF